MYVIDLTHYLDERGAIAPEHGPARKFADFVTAVVAHASDFDRAHDAPGPLCFKCRKRDRRRVETGFAFSEVGEEGGGSNEGSQEPLLVTWHCPTCGTKGQVPNWQGTFWDLSFGTPTT